MLVQSEGLGFFALHEKANVFEDCRCNFRVPSGRLETFLEVTLKVTLTLPSSLRSSDHKPPSRKGYAYVQLSLKGAYGGA